MKRSSFSADGSSSAAGENECRAYVRFLGAFLDGELDAAKQLEVEGHLETCLTCRERTMLDRAMRATLKTVVARGAAADGAGADDGAGATETDGAQAQAAIKARSDAMRARMRAAMMAEEKRETVRDGARTAATVGTLATAPFGWKAMLPLTAAAALALLWGAASQRTGNRSLYSDMPAATTQAGLGEDPLAELVAEHSRPLPPERTDALGLSSFEQYVGVPVHAANLEKAGARLVGGRVLPVHQERAAMLQYVVGKGADARRVSMFIYDPRKIRIGCNDCAPRAAGTAEVQVGRAGGYSVAVTQKEGVGYAVASDLDAEHNFELAALVDGVDAEH
jgi:anti-sigma factor RsiW